MLSKSGKLRSQTKSVTHARTTSLFEFSLEQAVLAFSQKWMIKRGLKSYVNITALTSIHWKVILLVIFLFWWDLFWAPVSQAYTWSKRSTRAHCSGLDLGRRSRKLLLEWPKLYSSFVEERWSLQRPILRCSKKVMLNDWIRDSRRGGTRYLEKIKRLGLCLLIEQ